MVRPTNQLLPIIHDNFPHSIDMFARALSEAGVSIHDGQRHFLSVTYEQIKSRKSKVFEGRLQMCFIGVIRVRIDGIAYNLYINVSGDDCLFHFSYDGTRTFYGA